MIVDFSEITVYMQTTGSELSQEAEDVLRTLHRPVEASIKNILRYNPERHQTVEYLPHDNQGVYDSDFLEVIGGRAVIGGYGRRGFEELIVNAIPVRLLEQVKVDIGGKSGYASNSFGSSTMETVGSDVWPDDSEMFCCKSGIIRRIGGWPGTARSAQITYTSGYSRAEFLGADHQPETVLGTLTFNASLSTITRPSGSFLDDGWRDGVVFKVSDTSNNDGRYIAANVTDEVLTLRDADNIENETVLCTLAPGRLVNASPLRKAVLDTLAVNYQQIERLKAKTASGATGPIVMENIGGQYQYQLDPGTMKELYGFSTVVVPPQVYHTLEPYIHPAGLI